MSNIPPVGCMRCHTIMPLKQLGLLWVCPHCFNEGFTSACSAFTHNYRGHEDGWVCFACGNLIPPQSIKDTPPEPPQQMYDMYI